MVPYLSEEAIFSTLSFIASGSGGAHVVFDYANPPDSSLPESATHGELAARVAAIGEAFKSFFETGRIHERLRTLGFNEIEDLGPPGILRRYFPKSGTIRSDRGGHVLRASNRRLT